MTSEEILSLEKTFRRHTELWKSAFNEYNKVMSSSGGKILSMHCSSCWFKVLKWHKEQQMLKDINK